MLAFKCGHYGVVAIVGDNFISLGSRVNNVQKILGDFYGLLLGDRYLSLLVTTHHAILLDKIEAAYSLLPNM